MTDCAPVLLEQRPSPFKTIFGYGCENCNRVWRIEVDNEEIFYYDSKFLEDSLKVLINTKSTIENCPLTDVMKRKEGN